jgi:serine protease Do
MKSKTVLTLSVAAVLALGLGPVAGTSPAQSQDKNAQRDTLSEIIAREAAIAGVDGTLAATRAQIEAAIAQASSAVNDEVAERVSERLQAALARSRALQDQAAVLAQDAVRSHVLLNGEEMSPMDDAGWLGVTPDDVSADRAKELKLSSARGVYISDIEKDSPAEKAGLKSGDVITEFNGEHLEGVVQFRRVVRETPPGRSVPITVWRDGHSQNLNVTLGSVSDQFNNRINLSVEPMMRDFEFSSPHVMVTPRPAPAPRLKGPYTFSMPDGDWAYGQGFGSGMGNGVFEFGRTPTLGIHTENLNGQLGSYFGAPDGEGVLVTEVISGTPAEKGGMKAGDVITKVDADRVKTLGELQSKLREKRDAKTVQLTVIRKGSETTVTVEPDKPKPATPRARTRPA